VDPPTLDLAPRISEENLEFLWKPDSFLESESFLNPELFLKPKSFFPPKSFLAEESEDLLSLEE
jgi:hypothetical protein